MADFAAWFRREDYGRIREIMEDSDRLPPSFDEWELLAKSRVAKAKRDGIILKPVMLDPDTFVAFCKARKMRPNGEARAKFAVDRGLAESSIDRASCRNVRFIPRSRHAHRRLNVC